MTKTMMQTVTKTVTQILSANHQPLPTSLALFARAFLAVVVWLWLLPTSAVAESSEFSLSPTQVTGCFSQDGETLSSESICLFADGSFYYPMLLNLTGSYELKGNKIVFYPKQYETFEVYGRVDPRLNNVTHFNFTGFNLDSLIDFNDTGFNYLPIEDIACHWQSKVDVYTHPETVSQFSLAYAPDSGDKDGNSQAKAGGAMDGMITLKYRPKAPLNDFLLIYHRPDISRTHAIVLTDGKKNGQVWLVTGKNQLSMSKVAMPERELYNLQKIGHKVAQSGNRFPKMIDQDDKITIQNPDNYFVDKLTNRLYPHPNKKNAVTGWLSYVPNNHAQRKTHFLKVYHKVDAVSQSMTEAIIQQRPSTTVTNCL